MIPEPPTKRWISLLVENDVGVLARIAGLFSGKSYNVNSLTVGVTEDATVSRMTVSLTSDERTFEQIKKQLNRSVEVIRVVDLTGKPVCMKELLFVRVRPQSSAREGAEQKLRSILSSCRATLLEAGGGTYLLESVQDEAANNAFIRCLEESFPGALEIARGGSVAIGTTDDAAPR